MGECLVRSRVILVPLALSLGLSSGARGSPAKENLVCTVEAKTDMGRPLPSDELARGRFSVRVAIAASGAAELARCSFAPSTGKVTCDWYEVDRVEFDPAVKHRKFYVFRSQFDVQVFADNSFVENNGRGGVAFGRCVSGAVR